MLNWIKKLLNKYKNNKIIKRDNCLLYCRNCRAVLNEMGMYDQNGNYMADCKCGMRSVFLLDTPVPILIAYGEIEK